MTHIVSRRVFVKLLTGAGAGLVLGVRVDRSGPESHAPDEWSPNAWIRIDPANVVTIVVAKAEMGQGVFTALPMIVAEELDADWNTVRIEQSPARAPYDTATGGSDSVQSSWTPLRQAGATARAMLVAAAAAEWNVATTECRTDAGFVVHAGTSRRASYGSLAARAATMPVPDPKSLRLKSPDEFRIVGKPIVRRDIEAKTDGSAIFGIDVRVPGMLVASVARCPFHGGTLAHVDDTKARGLRGVRRIIPLEPVRDAGLPARVAVVADDTWAAMKGRNALSIAWEAGASKDLSSDSLRAAERAAVAAAGNGVVTERLGDVDAAAAGARVIEQTYEVPLLAHTTMEPMNCTAHVTDSSAELWVPSQFGDAAQRRVADFLKLPVDAVTVHITFLGGGFGRRAYHDFVVEAVQLAKAIGKPVKVVWSREEDVQHDLYRPSSVQRVRAAVDEHGRPITWENRAAGQSNNGYWHPGAVAADSEHPETVQYAIPNRRSEFTYVGGPVPIGAWRSVRHSQNVFCTESFADELAHAAHTDPLEYRLALLDAEPRAQAVLHTVRDLSGWSKPLAKGRGRGVAYMKYGSSYVAQVAEVTVPTSGAVRVDRISCAFDCGQIINPDTLRAQLESAIVWGLSAALWGEITVRGGRTVQSNFHDYRVARMADMPVIDIQLLASREEPSGAGEPGVPCVAPAIANAIFAATGRRIRTLPLSRGAH